jgi:hypothetical protein
MTITTPTSTLGIRGTTGVVDVPDNAAAGGVGEAKIKLYPDVDGRVGRTDVFSRQGERLCDPFRRRRALCRCAVPIPP